MGIQIRSSPFEQIESKLRFEPPSAASGRVPVNPFQRFRLRTTKPEVRWHEVAVKSGLNPICLP
jgi:hypothetical protein